MKSIYRILILLLLVLLAFGGYYWWQGGNPKAPEPQTEAGQDLSTYPVEKRPETQPAPRAATPAAPPPPATQQAALTSDAELEQLVKQRLAALKQYSDIRIEVKDSVLYLYGKVNTRQELYALVEKIQDPNYKIDISGVAIGPN